MAFLCLHACRGVEFGHAVAHFSFLVFCFFILFSFLFSLFSFSLRCCQSPQGRISAATIGRPRQSKYMFQLFKTSQVGFVLLFSLLCSLSWVLSCGVSLDASEWLWAIKKRWLSTGRIQGIFKMK